MKTQSVTRNPRRIATLVLMSLASLLSLLSFPAVGTAQVERLPPPSQLSTPTMIMHPLWDAPVQPTASDEVTEAPASFFQPDPLFANAPEPITWYNPLSWFVPRYWDSSFEIGLNSSRGNANSFNIRTGLELTRETPLTTWDVDIMYSKNESNGVELQHNALAYSNWDWKLPVDRWSVFWKTGLEYDEFKNFDMRFNTNGGMGYLLLTSDSGENRLRGRFGSGASREFGGDDLSWHPEATFGLDVKRRLTERQKLSAVVDYFPNWTRFADYRIVSDFGWEVQIDKADNLSLKVNVIDRYDSTPNGARPNDVDYSVLVIWTL